MRKLLVLHFVFFPFVNYYKPLNKFRHFAFRARIDPDFLNSDRFQIGCNRDDAQQRFGSDAVAKIEIQAGQFGAAKVGKGAVGEALAAFQAHSAQAKKLKQAFPLEERRKMFFGM